MDNLIPVCFFKTKVVILDDDENWLNALYLFMNDKEFFQTSTNTQEIIKILKKNNPQIQKISSYNISEILADDQRFSTISVFISDFIMPQKNGIEIFEMLSYTNIKKILISSFTNYDSIYSLKKLYSIDAFLNKNIFMFVNKFSSKLNSFKNKFFISLFEDYLKNHPNLSEILSNKSFYNIFEYIINENVIEEFYFIDENGSCIMKSKDGRRFELVMMKDKEIFHWNRIYSKLLTHIPNELFIHPLMLKQNENITINDISNDNSRFFETNSIAINSSMYYYSFSEGNYFFKQFKL